MVMTETTSVFDTSTFTRAERAHLTILQERLDWLRAADRRGEPGLRAGEANALKWALATLEDAAVAARVSRLELWRRQIEARVGRIEKLVEEDDDE
jgi:hypothetical protein